MSLLVFKLLYDVPLTPSEPLFVDLGLPTNVFVSEINDPCASIFVHRMRKVGLYVITIRYAMRQRNIVS